MKKRDIITLAILAIIFIIVFAILYIKKENKDETVTKNEYAQLSLLIDESIFLSVSKNINKICEYANNNEQALDFIMKNDIYSDNYKNLSFNAKQIYVVSKYNLYKYYIKGSLYREIMDTEPEFVKEEYFILNYDMKNTSYNIEIINEERYRNAKNEEYIFETINSNEYNRFEYSNVSPKTRALMYFNDFVNKMYSNPEEAYNLLDNETRQKYFNTYGEFKNYILNHMDISLVEYSVTDNKIGIKDNYNTEYIFEITYILRYNVKINMTEE